MDNEAIPTASPIPEKTDDAIKTVNFFEALKAVSEGKRITKLEWADRNIYGILTDGRLKIMLSDNKLHDWIISDGDLNGADWMVLE